ncbi:MAG TPA: thioredoxin-disulfide reductase [Candidatus Kapabacteria bacterium]|nr:thioredoxin-disulfide reductase [Candidatus Kapabacteria bacterium]
MSKHFKVIIIGSGPAGLTAALYTSRANLSTLVFEGLQPGGQLTITTEVENYPGFPDGVQGPEMMEILRKQAQKFGAITKYETIESVDFTNKPFRLTSESGDYTADSIIIATGAKAKLLEIPSEQTYWGAGISACATCDGFFFRGEKIIVIGGGDTAMEEANYLTRFAESVTLVHRRDEFRASKIMLERTQKNPKINIITNHIVDEYLGEEKNGIKKLTHLRLKNVITGETSVHQAGGAFLAIGHTPNTKLFEGILDIDDNGYLITKGKSSYTNLAGVFACGDVQDHVYRQAITAAGSGCTAAIDAERWLQEQE